MPLPISLEEIDAAWLERSLRQLYPGVAVTSLRIDGKIGGTASKVRLRLAYNDVGEQFGLPHCAFLKGGFETHGFGHAASYVAEARFFANWAPRLSINLPRAWWSGADDDGSQGLVLLEDLDGRQAEYGDPRSPITPDRARAVLDLLAALHAQFWQSADLLRLRSYTDRFGAADYWLDRFLDPNHYHMCTEGFRGATAPREIRDATGMRRAVTALWSVSGNDAHAFCHGDSHLGNYWFESDGKPGLLDWQAYLRGDPLFDVAYFLGGALTTEDRRLHERELVSHYLEALGQRGVQAPPSFDAAWLSYRRYALHGFLWVAAPTAQHPEERIATYARRYGSMCADLDTLDAIGC
jgi:aminoglycoside phosphotransferase (APT) family kinase protein